MQIKENKAIDARTFPEIWNSLGTKSPKQLELRDELISKLHVSRQTINYWGNGKVKPAYDEIKKIVSSVTNKVCNTNTHYRTLFA